MTDLARQAEKLLNYDRAYYCALCAWCNRPAGGKTERCDHARELEGQSRGRYRELTRPRHLAFQPSKGPWFPTVLDVGLAPWPKPNGHLVPAAQPCRPREDGLQVA